MKYLLIAIAICCITSLLAQTKTTCPCCSAEYRKFDFWLGDWETTSDGKVAGQNLIELIQDSCVIQENWTGADGQYTGTSYNYFDPQDQHWHQTWIDNQGQSLRLTGALEGKSMVLKSAPMKSREGETVYHQITWTPNEDGSVRQHWQMAKENTNDWKTLFDGLYRRKN
jgi:hypothetical protein